MAIERDHPSSQFKFHVVVEGGSSVRPIRAAFHEVSGISEEVSDRRDRGKDSRDMPAVKIPGTHKTPDVTLKRGVIGDTDALRDWLEHARLGVERSRRTVTLQMLNESHSAIARQWALSSARPIKYAGPPLSGQGNDVEIEELVLASEGLEVKPLP